MLVLKQIIMISSWDHSINQVFSLACELCSFRKRVHWQRLEGKMSINGDVMSDVDLNNSIDESLTTDPAGAEVSHLY